MASRGARGVAAPACVGWRAFSLYEEGVEAELRALADGDAVVDQGSSAEAATVCQVGVVGLEDPVLHRVALDDGAGVECAVVADGHQRAFGDGASVVEEAPAGADAEQAPDRPLNGVPLNMPASGAISFQ